MDNEMQDRALIHSELVSAVSNGDLRLVRQLVHSLGLSSSQEWLEGYALLVDAIKKNHTKIAELLIRNGAKVNSHCQDDSDAPLMLAVMNDDNKIVEMLLNSGADIDIKNSWGCTALNMAVMCRYIQIIVMLLHRGADVHVKDYPSCYTPLHWAVVVNSEEIVILLLNSNANVDAKAKDGITPLHMAAEKGHVQIAKVLLNHGADIHSACTSTGYMPIHFSSQLGSKEAVRFFLRRGADVNAKAKDNLTPLHLAIEAHYEAVVRLLLEAGANVDAWDKSGKTILQFAVEKGNSRIVEDVLKYCPNIINESNRSSLETTVQDSRDILQHRFIVKPEDVNNPELLHNAVANGYLKTVGDLLKCGADVNMIDDSIRSRCGGTPLHTATLYKQVEIAKLLINYGANVNSRDRMDETPIFYAVKHNDVEIIKLFLTNGANIKDSPKYLLIAAARGYMESVEVLLKYGADVNYSDEQGKTALYFIIRNDDLRTNLPPPIFNINMHKRIEIVKLLLSKGADVNAKTENGITALHAAAGYGYSEIIEILLNFGAEIDSKDQYGRTALYIAVQEGRAQAVADLIANGTDVNIMNNMNHTPLEFADYGAYTICTHYDKYHSVDEYGHFVKPTIVSKIIVLKEHIGKLKAAGFYISKKNLELISDDANNEIHKIWNLCEREISAMKDNEISNSHVTYYDILTKNAHQLAIYATNENIVQAFKLADYKTKFPIYAGMMEAKFRRTLVRQELTEIFNQFFNFLYKGLPVLPLHCTEKIFNHLSMNDLQRLKYAYQPLNSSNTSDSDAEST